jgi:mRNA interferase MazF
MAADYEAHRGDIVWLTLDPRSGHEQMGRRPALVVSNDAYNKIAWNSAMVCPITNTKRENPLHLPVPSSCKTTGYVMCDQAKILDMKAREADYIESAPFELVETAADRIRAIVE